MNQGRFPPGRSGNPKGRPPKHAPFVSALRAFHDQKFKVKQNGVERELSSEEVLQLRAVDRAMKGNSPAIRTVLKMIAKREVWRASRTTRKKAENPFKIIIERDSGNAIEALCLLEIAIPVPYYYRSDQEYTPSPPEPDELEHFDTITIRKWAIEAALERRPHLPDDSMIEYTIRSITEKLEEGGAHEQGFQFD